MKGTKKAYCKLLDYDLLSHFFLISSSTKSGKQLRKEIVLKINTINLIN